MIRIGVVSFPGSNCDAETLRAAERVGAEAVPIWHQDRDLKGCDVVILPGGFSYGDYLRCGAIARFSPVMAAVRAHAEAGGGVVGICNGFQILCEAGLGDDAAQAEGAVGDELLESVPDHDGGGLGRVMRESYVLT